jgi:hypothetical protein
MLFASSELRRDAGLSVRLKTSGSLESFVIQRRQPENGGGNRSLKAPDRRLPAARLDKPRQTASARRESCAWVISVEALHPLPEAKERSDADWRITQRCHHVRPQVAINRNAWSQSIAIAGRDRPARALQTLKYLSRIAKAKAEGVKKGRKSR